MCCFSRPVDRVANTNIFARPAKDGRQYLVYSMTLSAKEDLAMILPLPVPKNPPEDAVRFISLKEYPGFFGDLKNGFPEPPSPKVDSRSRPPTLGQAPPLKVVEVGSFEASFVPAIKDFDRLDERFRLSGDVWGKLPQYKDAGFAVFKLKPGTKTVHPMAFEFPGEPGRAVLPHGPHPRRQGPPARRLRPRPVLPGERLLRARHGVARVPPAGGDVHDGEQGPGASRPRRPLLPPGAARPAQERRRRVGLTDRDPMVIKP
jgi:hypothetical protein